MLVASSPEILTRVSKVYEFWTFYGYSLDFKIVLSLICTSFKIFRGRLLIDHLLELLEGAKQRRKIKCKSNNY